jgi:hypothetical protein
MISKTLSLILVIIYLAFAYYGDGAETAFKVGMYAIIPLACIWFSQPMGNYTGTMRGQLITSSTPGCLVATGGWLLLLMPILLTAALLIFEKK